jgi:hypothetical protein
MSQDLSHKKISCVLGTGIGGRNRCVCMYLGGCLNWHILSLPCCCCCQGSRLFIATLGSVFHWKVLAWLELKSSQREETTHLLPSMMCFGCNRSTVPAVRSKVSDKGSLHTRKNIRQLEHLSGDKLDRRYWGDGYLLMIVKYYYKSWSLEDDIIRIHDSFMVVLRHHHRVAQWMARFYLGCLQLSCKEMEVQA